MKKIIFVLVAFIAFTLTSCNGGIKRRIEKKVSTEDVFVAKMKVKKIKIKTKFYQYDKDYVSAIDKKQILEGEIVNCKRDFERAGYDWEASKMIANGDYRKYEGYTLSDRIRNRESELQYQLDSVNGVIDNIVSTYPSKGKLYCAKILTKNRYGGYNDNYVFKVYYYNRKGKLEEYRGMDFNLIRHSCYSSNDSYYGFWIFDD